jgi:BlaI family penicillinase repressor
MAKGPVLNDLTRRERQIMDVVYRLGKATAVDIVARLPDEPVNATIRTLLSVLERKGYLKHDTVKGQFVYRPVIPASRARLGMLNHVLRTFFRGSEARAAIAILKKSHATLTDEQREEILRLVRESRTKKP